MTSIWKVRNEGADCDLKIHMTLLILDINSLPHTVLDYCDTEGVFLTHEGIDYKCCMFDVESPAVNKYRVSRVDLGTGRTSYGLEKTPRHGNSYLGGEHGWYGIPYLCKLSRCRAYEYKVIRKTLEARTFAHTQCARDFWMKMGSTTPIRTSSNDGLCR